MTIWLRCAQCTRGVLTVSVQGWWTRERRSCEVIQKPLEFKYPKSLLCATVQGNSKPMGSPTYRVQSGGLQNPLCNETVDKSIESEQIQRRKKKAPGCSGCPVEPCTFGMVRQKKKREGRQKRNARSAPLFRAAIQQAQRGRDGSICQTRLWRYPLSCNIYWSPTLPN